MSAPSANGAPVDVLAVQALSQSVMKVSADDVAAMLSAAKNVANAPRDMPTRRMEAAAFELQQRFSVRLAARERCVDALLKALDAPRDPVDPDWWARVLDARADLARVGGAP